MKYELTDETVVNAFGETLHRIKAKKSFGSVNEGQLGGFIEFKKNLSQSGDAWVFGHARVSGDAWVSGHAWVFGVNDLVTFGGLGSRYPISLFRTTTGHILRVGCWTGTVETLMDRVAAQRCCWDTDDATKSQWVKEYEAIKTLAEIRVASWVPQKSERDLKIEKLPAELDELKSSK